MSGNCHFWVEHKRAECGAPAEKFVDIAGVQSLLLCDKHYGFLSQKFDLDVFDRIVADKVVSLGASCFPLIRLKSLFSNERFLFDFSRVNHKTLLAMLESKFRNILSPNPYVPNENIVRIGFYDDYSGFWFGHRKRSQLGEIEETIIRRTKRFLKLREFNGHIVFLRLRNFHWDTASYLEVFNEQNALQSLEEEQEELTKALENFGFKSFTVVYVINSHALTLNGFITIPEGKLSDTMYCLENPECYTGLNWKGCFDFLNSHFNFRNAG